jgi:hypothetical protein
MTCGWRSLLALAAGAAFPPPAARAQQVRELGFMSVVTTADPVLVAGGLSAALRPSLSTRVSLLTAGGVADGRASGRAEVVAHLLFAPTRTRGAGGYLGGGVAGVVGPADRAYVVLVAGLESAPGARSGWALELGVGGGIRVAAGWRRRWFPPGWPAGG